MYALTLSFIFFFFNDTATTEIYTLSLHDALPIWRAAPGGGSGGGSFRKHPEARSEERFSRNAETDIVCRLLLEKKKKTRRRETNIDITATHTMTRVLTLIQC